jgi:hypothetical protein
MIAALIIVFIAGCTKEEISPNAKYLPIITKSSTQPVMRKFYDYGGDNYGCNEEKANCLPEVVIVGNKPEKVNQELYFKNMIINNQSALMTASQAISDDIIQGLTNGNYSIEVKYNDNDNTYYVLILDQSGNIVNVLPYKWQ